MTVYGRNSRGQFISKKEAQEREALLRRTEPTAKIVMFRERMRNTRIARTVRKAYAPDISDMDIQNDLARRYDNGGNYVIGILTIGLGYLKPGDEFVMDTEGPKSADRSP